MKTIKEKIAALLKMTTTSGCTEAEALAAAEKAACLMREYGLSETDIVLDQAAVRCRSKGKAARDELWGIVAYCTNTAPVFVNVAGERQAELTFVGHAPGPEIAAYLVTILNRAIDHGITDFKAGPFYRRRRTDATRRAAVRDFTSGMVSRLSRRLIEIFGSTIDKQASAVAKMARDEIFSGSKPVTAANTPARFSEAVFDGWKAGNRVTLSHGINNCSDSLRQIGENT